VAHYNPDLTKVRLFPEFPADEMKTLVGEACERLASDSPRLSSAQRRAVVLRRFQELV